MVALNLEVGNLDVGNLLSTETAHKVVVFRMGADCASFVVFFQTAENMCETLATRYSPLPAYMLKLVSAVIVALALMIPGLRENMHKTHLKQGGKAYA